MTMPLDAWKKFMCELIDGTEGALSVADPAPQKAKLASLRDQVNAPSVARHRKRLEDELDAVIEGDAALRIASRRYLRPKVKREMQKALVTLEKVKQALAKAKKTRARDRK